MDRIHIFCGFIENALRINTMVYGGSKEELEAFEKKNCFFLEDKSIYTASALELIGERIKDHHIYEIQDVSFTKIVLFNFEGHSIIAGPFVTKPWDKNMDRLPLIDHFSSPTFFDSYKLFYTGFPLIDIEDVKNIINAALKAFNPNEPKYTHRKLNVFTTTSYEELEFKKFDEYQAIINTYEAENYFLKMIERGNVDGVLRAKTQVLANYRGSNVNASKRSSSVPRMSLEEAKVTSNIFRILIRKPAERGGLHPVVINAITQSYLQKINATTSVSKLMEYNDELLLELTNEVHKKQMEMYSSHISQTVDYIRCNYSQPLSLDIISKEVGISPSHLSRSFKKETGATIVEYIRDWRCEEAKDLLRTTTLSVQDISSYVGYSDNNYFSKVFKDKYHMTPMGWRNGKRKE